MSCKMNGKNDSKKHFPCSPIFTVITIISVTKCSLFTQTQQIKEEITTGKIRIFDKNKLEGSGLPWHIITAKGEDRRGLVLHLKNKMYILG